MEVRNLHNTIQQMTTSEIVMTNIKFAQDLKSAIEHDFIKEEANEYYQMVMDEMWRATTLRYKVAPDVKNIITWYQHITDCDDPPWYHEIPPELTMDSDITIVNCMVITDPYKPKRIFKTIRGMYL